MNATQSYNLEKSHKAGSFDFSLCRLESPIGNLSFQRSKWATFRETNVDQIKATFAANPSSVFIMEDRKLLGSSLVVLRKDMFDRYRNRVNLNPGGLSACPFVGKKTGACARKCSWIVAKRRPWKRPLFVVQFSVSNLKT
jgi:hypothetical protein